KIRSVVVVLPASMCAAIPIFLTKLKSFAMLLLNENYTDQKRITQTSILSICLILYRCVINFTILESEVGERFVCFRHFVLSVFLLNSSTFTFRSGNDFSC